MQGLLLEWNFNQAEALHAFELAAEADPLAAMPHWGIAYALGPGANRCCCGLLVSDVLHSMVCVQCLTKRP